MIIFIIVGAISLFFLARTALVMAGLYKEPIIHVFEQYGPREALYIPMLWLFLWSGTFLISFAAWLPAQFSFTCSVLGVLLLACAGLTYQNPEVVAGLYHRFVRLPRWYHELRDRTNRYERRRIAYMWLHLPLKLRITFNSSDYLFNQWADFVILGTVREEEDTLKGESEVRDYSTGYWV
jgi:hypothetical protein